MLSVIDLAREIVGTHRPRLSRRTDQSRRFFAGVGAVLFVAIGPFALKALIVGPIGLTGLMMFLYGLFVAPGLQPWLPIVSARAHVEDGDAEPLRIAMRPA